MLPSRFPRNTHDQFDADRAPARLCLRARASGSKRETSGDKFKPEQHDHDEADGKDDRADQRLTGRDRAAESQAGGGAEQRAGKRAADEQVARGKRQFLQAGIDHRGDDVGRFCVIHIEAPAATRGVATTRKGRVIARKFDSKGSAVSEVSERSDQPRCCGNPSWTTASGHLRRLASLHYSNCVPVQQFMKNRVLFNG